MSVLLVAILSGCGPSIGLKTDFKAAHFEVNKTTRTDVVNYLGLPQKILTDSEGRKHFFYEGGTHLIGTCVGCGIPSTPGLVPLMINEAQVKNGAEYVFDANELLVAKFEPKKRSK